MNISNPCAWALVFFVLTCAPISAIAEDLVADAPVSLPANSLDFSPYKLVLPEPERYRLQASPEWRLQTSLPQHAVASTPPTTAARVRFAKRRFNNEVVAAAAKAGIDPALVHAVIAVESSYNPRAVSPKGAVGLMQLMPGTAQRYGVEDSRQAAANIQGGTLYLSELIRLFKGDIRLAIAAYNAGENAVLKYGKRIPPYAETQRYVPRVLELYRALSAPAL
jgi:soluble lytic murein transglycosylase-like protein